LRKNTVEAIWLIRRVAEGDSALDAEAIDRLSVQLGVSLGAAGAFCVAFKYANSALHTESVEKTQALYNACVMAVKALDIEAYCYIGNRLYTAMVIADSALHNARNLERIYRNVSRHCSDAVQMGVGNVCNSMDKLSNSRVEAYEALFGISNNSRISYIDDIYAMRNITTNKHLREKRQIVDSFKSGELEQLKTQMTQLVEHVRMETPVHPDRPYPTSIRRTVVEILFEIMHICADVGIAVEEILDYEDPYSKIFEMDSTPEILLWFFGVTEILSKCMVELQDKSESNLLLLAKKIMSEHLSDPELGLSLVSDTLGITSSYFSALFIREAGVGFNEYITGLRMEKAKQLLQKTNMKIGLIADQCGFHSGSYFIAVFRKYTGMSPGMYRKSRDYTQE